MSGLNTSAGLVLIEGLRIRALEPFDRRTPEPRY